ncbi:hypothetical protein BCR34DRAFT_584804 [Clohesyomyces aquaticus]|uniref:HAUS augmin-like complex subunit 1 n=1 Tax=Clohesyomyces aquaticus TaxID=1231657 RepID=A0A1Y2A021_9PLEO|nr:hypothetical protein BCR34DRAFT_584804 [Clohesyomyces aquaticus]
MENLTPEDLFSPSKARQQRLQAQDWAQIDSWLSYKYAGRTPPTFERNEETLKVMRELSTANERADEERVIQERLEREALKELDERTVHPTDASLLSSLTTSLTPTGHTALQSLTSTALTLSVPTPTPETLAHALIASTALSQSLRTQIAHVHTLQQYLETQHSLLRTQLAELTSNPAFSTPPSLQRQTNEQVRQTKHLKGRIRECEDKILALSSGSTSAQRGGKGSTVDVGIASAESILQMLEQQKVVEELREKVERLEKEVSAFAGLPADREAARREVSRLEVDLDGVRRKRDGLFEGLVGR